MAIYVAGRYGFPADAILINAHNRAEAVKVASKKLGADPEELGRQYGVFGPGDPFVKRVFTGLAVGRPRAVSVDELS